MKKRQTRKWQIFVRYEYETQRWLPSDHHRCRKRLRPSSPSVSFTSIQRWQKHIGLPARKWIVEKRIQQKGKNTLTHTQRKARREKKTLYRENQNKYILCIYLCTIPFPLYFFLSFLSFISLFFCRFARFFICLCIIFFPFFIWKFRMTGDDALIRSYRYTMWRQHGNEWFKGMSEQKNTATNGNEENCEFW